MVRWPREYGMWLLVGVLTVLLGLLAMLQYRWTGEIGRAEAERQQNRLERSARRFAQELRHEVGQVGLAFRPGFRGQASDVGTDQLDRLARWEQSRHAELVSRMIVVTRSPSGELVVEAAELGTDTLVPIRLPAGLEPVGRQLEEAGSSPGLRGGFRWDWTLRKPLALVAPIVRPAQGRPRRLRPEDLRLEGATVLELNVDYFAGELLPQLAEVHFGPLDEGDYAVAVLDDDDGSILYSSDPSLGPDELVHGDVRLSLLSQQGGPFGPGSPGRFDRGPRPAGGRPRPGAPPPGFPDQRGGPGDIRRPPGDEEEPGPWILVVRHHGGSLAEAVAGVRRRNLGVGLGILLLLGTAAVVLAVSGQRARRLARQQLEFVAGVTHEIHTPLAAIRSAGQNLADGVVSEAQQVRRYGDLIQKEGGRLTALVAQVLDFAGIESGSRAYSADPVQVAPLVHNVVGDLSLILEQASMTVEMDIPEDLPDVLGDGAALRRALENLITNAAKFAGKGGWVRIRAAVADDRSVELRVSDRGPGIPKSERRQVFEPFYRGRSAQQSQAPGSGLGLSFVRHVVEAHQGRVSIEPRDEGGTTVLIELPTKGPPPKEPA